MKPQDIERCNFELYNKESTYLDNISCRQPKHLYISQSSFVSISYHMNFHKSEQAKTIKNDTYQAKSTFSDTRIRTGNRSGSQKLHAAKAK